MKGLVLSFLIVFPLLSIAQKDSVIKYSGVVIVDSVNKDQLYQRARGWFNDNFKSSKDVIQIQDKETGEISGKGIISSTLEMKYLGSRIYTADYDFSFKVFVKDGKYKYETTDFDNILVANNSASSLGTITSSLTCPIKFPMIRQSKMDEIWKSAKERLEPKISLLIASLKKAMISSSIEDF